MRVGFRTTLEKDVVDLLKKCAIDQGLHANDILEKLVLDNLQNKTESNSFDGEDIVEFSSLCIAEAINNTCIKLNIKNRNKHDKLIYEISTALAKIIIEDDFNIGTERQKFKRYYNK